MTVGAAPSRLQMPLRQALQSWTLWCVVKTPVPWGDLEVKKRLKSQEGGLLTRAEIQCACEFQQRKRGQHNHKNNSRKATSTFPGKEK